MGALTRSVDYRNRRAAILAIVPWLVLVLSSTTALAQTVELDSRIGTIDAAASREKNPVVLDPNTPARLEMIIGNQGTSELTIRTVRLEGRVIGLTFFVYDTAVNFLVPPGTVISKTFSLDLGGMNGQATGLIPGEIKLLDAERAVVASQGVVLDVRGSILSVYGLFGLAIAAITLLSLAGTLLRLARHRLPENRMQRALRFLGPGIGLGLSAVYTLSVLRIFVPRTGRWSPVVLAGGGVLFVLGYLSPHPSCARLATTSRWISATTDSRRFGSKKTTAGIPMGTGYWMRTN